MAPMLTWGAWRAQAKAQLPPPTESFAGKTVLITGAKGVVCSEVARILIRLGVGTLVLAVRGIPEGPEGEPALEALLGPAADRSGTRVLVWPLDLLSFDSVKALAARANKELPRLDVLLNGAARSSRDRQLTKEGWEYGVMVNHLAPALLTLLLLPLLKRTADEHNTTAVAAEIASLGSRMSRSAMPNPPATPATDATTAYLSAVNAKGDWVSRHQMYGITKLLFCHFLHELAAQLQAPNVQFHSADFGVCKVQKGVNETFKSALPMMYLLGREPGMCANVVVNSCIAHEGAKQSFYVDYDAIGLPDFMADESGVRLQKVVWEETRAILLKVSPEAYDQVLPKAGASNAVSTEK